MAKCSGLDGTQRHLSGFIEPRLYQVCLEEAGPLPPFSKDSV